METNDGVVVVTLDKSLVGFTPNVVLRESWLMRSVPTSLAVTS